MWEPKTKRVMKKILPARLPNGIIKIEKEKKMKDRKIEEAISIYQ